MKAIQVSKFGGPEVLKLVTNLPLPKCKENEVLIKVGSVGINPVDTYIRSGVYNRLPELPYTPGADAAGVVLEIHEKAGTIQSFKPGDRVYTSKTLTGSYASHVVASIDHVHHLPNSLTLQQGAAVGTPYFTAFRALVTKGKGKAGEKVLIHGASGAVGLACCQIAKSLNMCVYATAGTQIGLQLVKDNGAERAFNHRLPDYMADISTATDGGVDLVIEMLANVNLVEDSKLLRDDGRIMIVGSRGPIEFDPRLTMSKEILIQGVALYHSTKGEWSKAASVIGDLLKEGALKPVIAQEYNLELASQGHIDIVSQRGAQGKLVLNVT